MDIKDFCLHDSQIDSIKIEYNKLELILGLAEEWNNTNRIKITCDGFIGINNLCIFDDDIIKNCNISKVYSADNNFLKKVYKAYDVNYTYDNRKLSEGIIKISFELTNNIIFDIYCLHMYIDEI